jgi:16S rRNA pseudouridine516 synthase
VDLPGRLQMGGVPVDPPPPLTVILHEPLGVVRSHREVGRTVYDARG